MSGPLFSERHDPEKRAQYDSLHEGIPDFLFSSLLDWTIEHYRSASLGKRPKADRQAVLRLERKTRRTLPSRAKNDLNELAHVFHADDALFLSAIELALRTKDEYDDFEGHTPHELEIILKEAASAYCVGRDEKGYFQLQFRQSEGINQLIQSESNQPGRASEHLRRAWSKCFGLNPDANEACSEAVKAIEVAAKPEIAPNDDLITLGRMCGLMRKNPRNWETDSEFDGSVKSVLAMMDMVWKGHYRHGDETAPLEVTQKAAEMTVQTAVLLVSWFRSGRIRLKQ